MSTEAFNTMRKNLIESVTGSALDWLAYMGTDAALAAIPDTNPPRYVVAGTLADIVKLLPATEAFTVPPLTAPAPLTCSDVVREAIEATFEQRPGYMAKVGAAVRALDQAAPAPLTEEQKEDQFWDAENWERAREKARARMAAPAHQQSEGLSDERIAEIYRAEFNGMPGAARQAPQNVPALVIEFARAIEREVAKAAPAAQVQTAEPFQFDEGELRERILQVSNTSHWCGKIGGDADDYADHLDKAIAADEALFNYVKNLAAPVQAEQAQAEPVDQGHVLRTLRRLLDGSQPQDIPGAVMVIDNALKDGIAWSYDIAPPQGFIAYVKANYTGDVHFHDPEWHATRLWNAAMKNAGSRIALPAQAEQAAAVRAAALEEAAKTCEAWGNQKVANWSDLGGEMLEDAKARAWDSIQCAAAIRALAAPSTATSNDTAALGKKGAEA